MSPTYKSRISTLSITERSPLLERHEPSVAIDPSDDIIMTDQPSSVEEDSLTPHSAEVHHFLRWAQKTGSHAYVSPVHTIRHSNMVVFAFAHLIIPGERRPLEKLLSHLARRHTLPIRKVADSILLKLRDQGHGVLVTSELRIEQLRSEWLRRSSPRNSTSASNVRALFSVRNFVNPRHWQIERELLCISCNREAAQWLASIAGIPSRELQISTSWAEEMDPFPSFEFTELRSIAGRGLATLAVSHRAVYLMHGLEKNSYQWVEHNDADELTTDCFSWCFDIRDLENMGGFVDRASSEPTEVLGKPLTERLNRLIKPMVPARSAILLNTVANSICGLLGPTWCLMIFKQVDFNHTPAIQEILTQFSTRKECFVIDQERPLQDPEEFRALDLDGDCNYPDVGAWLQELKELGP